jgi:2-polyprenyl-3-methyl-5-hydroxy-6-metoxy-1,4-benzoquinol methylase
MSEPPIRAFPGVHDRAELRRYVLEHGPLSREENERVYEHRFAKAPRHLFRAVDERYGLTDKRLCDVGCGFGENLVFAAPGSLGLDVDRRSVEFAQALGLDVRLREVLYDDLADIPPVEAVWCAAVLEHVESTHLLLRRLHSLLEPNGLLAVYVPTIPALPWLGRIPKLRRLVSGYGHSDHINAFVPATLRFVCEHAGFRTLQVSPLLPGPLRLIERMPPVPRLIGLTVYVGRAIPGWDYTGNATRRASEGGFTYIGRDSVARGDADVREPQA